jgi:hypothetical protein
MGYTHYWRFHKEKMKTQELREVFQGITYNINYIFDKLPQSKDILHGGLGEGEPIINETEVWFNGDESQGLDHETFCINWKDQEAFGFCKTARKPYDLFVCLALLSFYEYFPSDVFTLSSDGDAEDWQEAVDLYNQFSCDEPVTDKDLMLKNPFDKEEVLEHMTK